ncbi:hypothetical protein ES703_94126 [subsurface metagenome]
MVDVGHRLLVALHFTVGDAPVVEDLRGIGFFLECLVEVGDRFLIALHFIVGHAPVAEGLGVIRL